MLGFSTQHPTVSCGTERPHLPPLGPAGVTNPPLGWPIVTKPRFRPSVSTAKSRYFNNLRLPHQTHTLQKCLDELITYSGYTFPAEVTTQEIAQSNALLVHLERARAILDKQGIMHPKIEKSRAVTNYTAWIEFLSKLLASELTAPSPLPRATTWMPEAEAYKLIRSSSLVRLRRPNDVTGADLIARALGSTHKTPGEQLADELSRHLLREFASELPRAARNGQYGKEPLQWWIDKEADRRTAK